MIRILLVDDHAVVREGYRHFLERTDDLRVVGEAAGADEGYAAWLRCAPDVTVVDLSMRDRGGLWLLAHIAARSPAARCLVFTMHEAALVAQRALEAGACGYVTKSSPPEVLVQAVRAAHAGRVYLSADILQARAVLAQDADRLASLSVKEHEIFVLLAEGRTVAEIARRLNLSAKTVANHQSQIRDKRYRPTQRLQFFAHVDNAFDRRYGNGALLGESAFDAQGRFVARPLPAVDGEFPLRNSTFFAPGAPRTFLLGLRYAL